MAKRDGELSKDELITKIRNDLSRVAEEIGFTLDSLHDRASFRLIQLLKLK